MHLRGHAMITKFDSSYYGTVDMENLGYAGTPVMPAFRPAKIAAAAE